MLWSILIAGIPERYHLVQPLLYSLLEKQSVARMPDVELLYLLDNRKRSVGAKRNALMAAAVGEYVSFIDDDDMVADDYVRRIHDAIVACRKRKEPTDVICFRQIATLVQEGVQHDCTYSLAHWRDREPAKRRQLQATDNARVFKWTGPPAHTMVWRREIAGSKSKENNGVAVITLPIAFPEKQFGEDVDWVDAMCVRAKTEMQIEGEPLYQYRFDAQRTATR